MNPTRMIAGICAPTTDAVGPERRGERVGGGDAGDADDDGADEADRAGAEALLDEMPPASSPVEWAQVAPRRLVERSSRFSFRGRACAAPRSWEREVRAASSLRSNRGRAGAAARGGSSRRRRVRRAASSRCWTASSMLSPRPTTASASMTVGQVRDVPARAPRRRGRHRRCG